MLFDRLFARNYPQLDWIQVEISSYCNASCVYCPHWAFRPNWQNRFLSLGAFRNLVPAFSNTHLVYLQGWGEPFTHPQFFEMLQIAKKAGCRVGTTTNGTLLDRESIEKIVSQGLDVIGFSLAGVNKKNDEIRKGTHLKRVLLCMEEIHRAKERYQVDNPEIHIAYMLLRSGLGDLETLPKFLANTGAAQTVVSSLSYVVSPEMETESKLASSEEEYSELKVRLLEIRKEAVKLGMDLHFHLVSPIQKKFSCSENIPQAVVVGSNGNLSPCVIKQLPMRGDNYYLFDRQKHLQCNLSFGNIQEESLNTIQHHKQYRQFVREFLSGNEPAACQNCLKKQIENFS
ncbi:MAG: radical SAM protein [Desulfobacterales bacterium]|jgi:MoaA/NifB/PqqE/SkfB family radical SAM enzyme